MRTPAGLEIGIGAGILSSVAAVVMHVFTLPVEFDASFNRALLLLLKEGRFIPAEDLGAARHILAAAAYTYVASALIDIINLPRWIRGLW
jgi:Zn-dependent membrane protease YugP